MELLLNLYPIICTMLSTRAALLVSTCLYSSSALAFALSFHRPGNLPVRPIFETMQHHYDPVQLAQ